MRDCTDAIAVIARTYFGPDKPAAVPPAATTDPPAMSDDAVFNLALRSRIGPEFQAQFAGDNPIRNGDVSANDLSFCNKLAFYTKDPEQLDRLFRSTPRMRDKWDVVHFPATGETYGAHTIRLAIEGSSGAYDPDYHRGNEAEIDWQDLKRRSFADLDNADAFAEFARGRLIFTDGQGYLAWQGNRWVPNKHTPYELVEEWLDSLRREAGRAIATAQTEEQLKIAKDFASRVFKLRGKSPVENMLGLAAHKMFMLDEQLDANPIMLNTPSGIIDLRTGAIRPARPDDYCSQITGCGLDPTRSAAWEEFLNRITDSDAEYQHYMQVSCSQLIIGKVYNESVLLAHGQGGNGKSTFFNTLFKVAGLYAIGVDPDILLSTRQNKEPALMALKGRRYVLAGETEEGQRLSTARLKQISSTDQITGRRLYHDQITFTPSHTLVVYTNHLPKVGGTDVGTWSRLTVLPFVHKWDRKSKGTILDYSSVLFEQAGGWVLSWLVEGAKEFLAAGGHLPQCAALEHATEAYRRSEDWLSNFITDTCELGANQRCGAQELYQAYRNWALSTGEYCRRQTDFNEAMSGQGFQKIIPGNRKTWLGLRLTITEYGTGAASLMA